jgi:hypothetical protein
MTDLWEIYEIELDYYKRILTCQLLILEELGVACW